MAAEQKLQTKCIEYLESKGAYVVKVITATKAGVLDTLVCYNGLFIAFEFKDEGNEASLLQVYNVEKIIKAGGRAYVIKNLEALKRKINLIDEYIRMKGLVL